MDKILAIALPLIKEFEGCKLKAYADLGGRLTIGWGHTGDIQPGETWAQAQADEQLDYDVTRALKAVQGLVKVKLNDNQMAALTSFTYNLGPHNLAKSGLLKFVNYQKWGQAADQFLLWNHIGMYVSPGLTRRREAEKALFIKEAQ